MSREEKNLRRRGSGNFTNAGKTIAGIEGDTVVHADAKKKKSSTKASEPHPVVPGLTMDFVPFFNFEPRKREVRRAQMDKETLEKQRLKNRTGGYHTYDEFQCVVGNDRGTPGYQTEAQRFDTDFAGEEKKRREQVLERKHLIYDKRREINIRREEDRFQREAEKREKELERWKAMQENHTFGKKNLGSTPYNQITLKYNSGKDGQALMHDDAMVKWRAAHRARRLQEKMGGGRNPITGESRDLMNVPVRPTRPQ